MSTFIDQKIEQYIEDHTSNESEILKNLERNTHLTEMKPRMLSGKVQGKFLSIISKMMNADRILEIGTFTGYSAICLAEGLKQGGKLITIDINEERIDIVQNAIESAGFQDKIVCKIGAAEDIIPQLDEVFDIVFIDADKINYSLYFDLVIDKLRSGGIILADNVLWSGKVTDDKKDKDTLALLAFNQKVQQDIRVENVILSIRDGITLIYKK
jgi:caffeoyl-CoA O-methyltransferase